MQGLQPIARGLVLVHAGQPVAEEGALDEMPGVARAGALEIDGGKGFVDLAIEAQGAAGHGDPLGLLLGLVADRLVGGHGIEDAGLGSSQAQMLDGRIIKPQGVFRGARPLDGQQGGQGSLVRCKPGADPGGESFGGTAPPASQA